MSNAKDRIIELLIGVIDNRITNIETYMRATATVAREHFGHAMVDEVDRVRGRTTPREDLASDLHDADIIDEAQRVKMDPLAPGDSVVCDDIYWEFCGTTKGGRAVLHRVEDDSFFTSSVEMDEVRRGD